jgi:DNA-binding SARP family transcriptional activator
VEIGILGPLNVIGTSGSVAVPGPRQRALLARLLLQANSTVSVDQLAESVWDGDASADGRAALPSYVLRLRRALGAEVGARVVTRSGGYAFELDRAELDLHRFQDLRSRAGVLAGQGDHRGAYESLDKALGLWRGEPLEDVQTLGGLQLEMAELSAARVQAWIDFFDEGLQLGRHAAQLPDITAIARRFPFDERLQAQWILALYRCGRQKEALGAYQEVRNRLVDELGIEPTARLASLNQQMLRADPQLLGTAEAKAVKSGAAHAPRHLPASPRHFTGRAQEMEGLRKLLVEGASAGGQAMLALLTGTAGVGKTALAVRFAHEVADRFPDGQLYIDLHGYDATLEPMDAPAAVRRLLGSLMEGRSASIPTDPDAQLAAYRRCLADTRTLIVLDNARRPEQIRPLIPGSSQSLVLITSRDQLPGLVALDGALPMPIGLLPDGDAWELVARRLGRRVAGSEDLLRELINLCSRLPLALNIATALIASRPDTPVEELVEQLRSGSKTLDVLSVGEAAGDVRAVVSWSYRALDAPSAKLFRLLGLHPGPDISAPAAASLAGIERQQAERVLRRLVDANLLTESAGAGRYAMHDLLRAYAVELSDLHSTPHARSRAFERVLNHYLYSGYAAAPPSYARWLGFDLQKAAPGVTPEQFAEWSRHRSEHTLGLHGRWRAGSVIEGLTMRSASTEYDSAPVWSRLSSVWQGSWSCPVELITVSLWPSTLNFAPRCGGFAANSSGCGSRTKYCTRLRRR